MNSPIKLPPPSFYQKHEDVCGDEVGPPTPFWNQAAVEQAVRDALAAQTPLAHELPCWEEISAKNERGETLTALELFIYDNEPAGVADEAWRDQLADALTSFRENNHE